MLSRRDFLQTTLATGTLVVGCGGTDGARSAGSAEDLVGSPTGGPTSPPSDAAAPDPADAGQAPTPSCEESTDPNTLGPYYKAGAPQRTSLVHAGMPGTRLAIVGRVLGAGRACAPLAGAEIDVWQADDAGGYDSVGFTLRGKFKADALGAFRIETIVPGHYLNGSSYRPRHVHVIVRAPGRAELTTQLYFEGDPYNTSDPYFEPSLVMSPKADGAGGQLATFDFVLA